MLIELTGILLMKEDYSIVTDFDLQN